MSVKYSFPTLELIFGLAVLLQTCQREQNLGTLKPSKLILLRQEKLRREKLWCFIWKWYLWHTLCQKHLKKLGKDVPYFSETKIFKIISNFEYCSLKFRLVSHLSRTKNIFSCTKKSVCNKSWNVTKRTVIHKQGKAAFPVDALY